MGSPSINASLLAQSYDPTRTGYVNLRNNDRALGAPGAKVSVNALASALGKDQIVISQGAIQARKPGTPAVAPTMQAVQMAQHDQEDLMWSNWPGEQYQYIDASGNPQYYWQPAIQDLRNRLQAIQKVATRGNDDSGRTIANQIRWSLQQNQWNAKQGQNAGQNVYQQLYATLASVTQGNPDPIDYTVGTLVDQVNSANQSVSGLNSALKKAGGQQRVIAQLKQQVAQAQDAINKTPGWQNFLNNLPQGDSGYPDTPDQTLSRLQSDLQAVQSVDLTALQNQLLPVAQKAYGAVQSSWTGGTPANAAALSQNAKALEDTAKQIQGQADDATRSIQDLENPQS